MNIFIKDFRRDNRVLPFTIIPIPPWLILCSFTNEPFDSFRKKIKIKNSTIWQFN